MAINTDEMNDLVLRGLVLDGLLARARIALKWCNEHEGECLADHPGVIRRFRDILAEIDKFAGPE